MENNEEHVNGVKKCIDDILGTDTFLKRKKKSEDDINRERFEKIINTFGIISSPIRFDTKSGDRLEIFDITDRASSTM